MSDMIYIAYGVIGSGSKVDVRSSFVDYWPPDEVHDGITSIVLKACGDHIFGCYLEVVGVDEELVVKKWTRVADNIPLDIWWTADNKEDVS